MKELTNKIFKDTFIVMFSNVINYAGMFILAVMVSRIIGVNSLGEFTYIFAISSILSVISEFGLSQLLIRKINTDRANIFSVVKNVNVFKFLLSVICVIAAGFLLSIVPGSIFNMTLAAGIALIIPKAIQTTYESAIRALMNQKLPSIIKSINSLIQIILAYLILLRTADLFSLLAMMFIMECITALVFKFACSRIWQNSGITLLSSLPFSFSFIKPLIKEAFPFFGSNFLSLSISRVILIILGNITTQVTLGIFSAASRFSNGVGLLSGALYNTFYPAMTDPGTPIEVRYSLAKKFSLYAFLAGLLISFTIYLTAGLLIDLTFKIPEAVPVLKLMAFVVIPILVYSVIQPFLFSLHHEKFVLRTYLTIWILNIFTSLYLININGYMGAAVSSLIADYLVLIFLLIKFYRTKSNNL